MKNKEYFFVRENQKYGPISLEEIINSKLSGDTLIWYEDLDEWTRLDQLAELSGIIKERKIPPPIPEKLLQINTISNIKTNEVINTGKYIPKPNVIIFLAIWTCLHLIALITSTKGWDTYNVEDKFWPFVKFLHCYPYYSSNMSILGKDCKFNGPFTDYDITEFLFYIIAGFLVIFIIEYNRYNKDKKVKK